MQIHEAAQRLGLSQRILRHYEKTGLLSPTRSANGYRIYSETDVRRASRIRDMIATGFSTREILAMAPCLGDEGAGACREGLVELEHKRSQIDRLIAELAERRAAVIARIEAFEASLRATSDQENDLRHELSPPDHSVSHRLPGGGRRVSARPDSDTDR